MAYESKGSNVCSEVTVWLIYSLRQDTTVYNSWRSLLLWSIIVYSQCLKEFQNVFPFLPQDSRRTVVHALITSHLDYANSLYAEAPAYLIRCLQTVQNAVARLIYNIPYCHSISPYLKKLHWLPVAKRIQFKSMVLVFRSLWNTGPATWELGSNLPSPAALSDPTTCTSSFSPAFDAPEWAAELLRCSPPKLGTACLCHYDWLIQNLSSAETLRLGSSPAPKTTVSPVWAPGHPRRGYLRAI